MYQIERDMPLEEFYGWAEHFAMKGEEREKARKKAARAAKTGNKARPHRRARRR